MGTGFSFLRLARIFTFIAAAPLCAAVFSSAAAQEGGVFGDITARWCLNPAAKEIYAESSDFPGERETLIAEGEETDGAPIERIFDDVLSDKRGLTAHRVELIGAETKNKAGHRCQAVRLPGFAAMFGAFIGSFGF